MSNWMTWFVFAQTRTNLLSSVLTQLFVLESLVLHQLCTNTCCWNHVDMEHHLLSFWFIRKKNASYHYFLSTLVGLRPQLSAVKAVGSDGEESLIQALKSSFPWAQQLRCFLHMRRNIKSKLHELNVSTGSSLAVVEDIFGKSDGTTFHEGLVDASNTGQFFSQLEGMEDKWNNLECADTKQPSNFFCWFKKNQSCVFASCMIKPVREAAGMGCPLLSLPQMLQKVGTQL